MIIKRGDCHSTVTISSSLFRCAACGCTDVDSSGATSCSCPSCGTSMTMVAHSEEGCTGEENQQESG